MSRSSQSTCSSCWTPSSSTAEVLVRHARSDSERGDSLHRELFGFLSAVLRKRLQDLTSEYAQGIPRMDQPVQAVYERGNSPQDRTEAIDSLLGRLSVISDLDDETRARHYPQHPNKEWWIQGKGEWESYFRLYDLVFAELDAGRFAQSCWALAVLETRSFWWILWDFAQEKDNDELVFYIVNAVVPEIACGECFMSKSLYNYLGREFTLGARALGNSMGIDVDTQRKIFPKQRPALVMSAL